MMICLFRLRINLKVGGNDNMDRILKDALLTVVIETLSEIDDLDTVCDYNFDMPLYGKRLKGVIKVEFEEVE